MSVTPKLMIINSFAGYGRISLSVALPVVSVLGVQGCALPGRVLSSHQAFSPFAFQDLTDKLPEFTDAWDKIGFEPDGIYVGYLAGISQISFVSEYLQKWAGIKPLIMDPVMGDHGKPYTNVIPAQIPLMRKLAALADILLPNLTEACMLCGVPYIKGILSDQQIQDLLSKLDPSCTKTIVLKGITVAENRYANILWEKGKITVLPFELTGASRPGTGDIFASVIAAEALKGIPVASAVSKAADFISLCVADSEKAHLPVKEGVLFERNLKHLFS